MSKKNDLSGSHIVLDGALYMCNQGAVPSSIVVTNNNKLFVQNKKVATVDDTTFQTPALTFGTCLLSPKKQAGQPCEYANGKWDSETCYIDKIVLDSSKMYCSAFAPQGGEISCLFHGQVMGVTATDFANFEPDAAIALNSLLSLSDFEEKKSEKPKGKDTTFGISAIELYRTNQIGRTFIPTPREKNPKHIRPSEILILEAKTNSKTNLKGQPVSWIVFQKEEMISEQEKTKKKQTKITVVKNLKIYPKVGSPFSIKLKKSGKYYIEAVGNGNNFKSLNLYYQMQKNLAANDWVVKTEKLPLDAKCCKEIIVCSNDIIGLTPLGNKEEIKLPSIERYDLSNAKTPIFLLTENFQKITKYTSSAVIVRPNEPLEIKVDTIFEVKDDEYLTVHLNHFCIDYMLNSEVETSLYSFDPKTKIFKLKPPFNTGDYRIRFELNQMNVCTFMRPKTLGIGSLLIHCISDYLDVNASSGGTEKPLYIRPGASLQFRAVTNNGKNKIDGSKIVWNWGEVIPPKSKTTAEKNKSNATQEPSEPAKMTKTGDKLIINSEKKEYKLRVEAYVNDSNFIFEGKRNRDIETAKKWSFECEVKKNRIKKIWLDADEAYIGMTYNMNLECLYPDYIPSADGEILGSLNGEEFLMENGKRSFVFDTAGRQNLSLKMGNTENITEEFEVYDINVGEWGFFDSERHHIKQVGFSTKFNLLINIPAFKHLTEKERSEIRLELWDERTGTKLETEVLNEVKFDEKGYINVELMGYEITDRTDDITLSCAFVNLPYHVSGLNDEKHNGHFFYTKAKKLIISEKVYINGFFAGNSGNPQKSILRYGTEAKIVLYLHNFSKNKRENSTILLVENNSSDDLKDTLIWKSEIPQPNDDGRVEIVIPENIIKEDDHNAETPRIPRLFYFKVVYHNPITEELSLLLAYPAQKIGDDFKIELNEESVQKLNCNYFWQLKYALEDYVGNLNKNLGCSALTIIGEELDYGEKKKECKECLCKKYNLPYGNLLKCNERKKVVEVCKELFGEDRAIDMAQKLMICMQIETGKLKPSKESNSSSAVGLIQFTPTAINEINRRHNEDKTSREELLKMNFIRQMDYVKYYFEPFVKRLKKHNTIKDMYLCIFWPQAVEKNEDFILCKKGSEEYRANFSLDKNDKGYICKKDFDYRIEAHVVNGEVGRRDFLYECINIDKRNNKYCPRCGKVHIDIRDIVTFQTQFDSIFGDKNAQNISCYKACLKMLQSAGLPSSSGSNSNIFFFAEEIKSGKEENDQHYYLKINSQITNDAIRYLDEQLSLGHPVLVGVDHKYKTGHNNNQCDHFIVIVARWCSDGLICYQFYDPGTSHKLMGTNEKNILVYNEKEQILEGSTTYNNKNYIVTQIRRN